LLKLVFWQKVLYWNMDFKAPYFTIYAK